MTRSAIAGYLLLIMMLLRVFGSRQSTSTVFILDTACGSLTLLSAILLFTDLRLSAKIQVGVLFTIGVLLLGYAYMQGSSFSLIHAFSRNTELLSLILSVGFLKLLLDLELMKGKLPKGVKAHLHTLIGLGLFGSILNVSAPIMMCDRLAEEQPIDLFTARSMTRVYCACSSWSPYFAGTALVLTLVDNVSLVAVMLTGFPLLVVTIVSTHLLAVFHSRDRLEQFAGYPLAPSKLWLPVTLTITVVVTQAVMPSLPILVVISFSALLLSTTVLLYRSGLKKGARSLQNHITDGLPRSSNELLLFLSAGVLATGLTAYLATSDVQITLSEYTLEAACLTLAVMIIVAAAGIHPVIQISVLTPFLLPINPDPELLAMTYLFSWGLGNLASPLSGTHLIFQGRYGISAWQGAVQNWSYVIPMYFVAIGLMALLTRFS